VRAFRLFLQMLISGHLVYSFTGHGQTSPVILEPYTFSTLAGSTTRGYTNGMGRAAQFYFPAGVVLDAAGNLYVADRGNSVIRKITPSGVVTTLAGQPGVKGFADGHGPSAQFDNAYGLAMDPQGNILVADSWNNVIRTIAPDGSVSTFAGDSSQLNQYGHIQSGYVDGPRSSAQFFQPTDVAVDKNGNVYVADWLNYALRKIDGGGQVTTVARFERDGIFNVAVDGSGNVLVPDDRGTAIHKVTPAGVVTTFVGKSRSPGLVDGIGSAVRFSRIAGVVVDRDGNLFVADPPVVRKVTPQGEVATLGGAAVGYADGIGLRAHFQDPTGMTVDSGGTLYFADSGNNNVRTGVPAPVSLSVGPASIPKGGHFGFSLMGPTDQMYPSGGLALARKG